MSVVEAEQPSTAAAINASIETVFGNERYLERVTDRLYAQGIRYVRELIALSAPEFIEIVGHRVSNHNIKRVNDRLKKLGLSFRQPI